MVQLDLLDTILSELPEGWEVQLTLERTSHKVCLYNSERSELQFIETGKGLHADVEAALSYAKQVENIAEESVNKAWNRFQTAIKRLGI